MTIQRLAIGCLVVWLSRLWYDVGGRNAKRRNAEVVVYIIFGFLIAGVLGCRGGSSSK